MHELVTSVEIDAPAETVWAVLTDFEAYPEWNDFTRIEGEPVEGTTLQVTPGPEAGNMPTFEPTVLAAEEPVELRWLGHLLVRGLFDGEHRFEIKPLGAGGVRLTQSETFRGLLAGLIVRRYGDRTERTFVGVNEALRTRAESIASGESSEDHGATGSDEITA